MVAELLFLGVFQVTAYQAVPAQTKAACKDNWHCETAVGDRMTPVGCAVSQDLLASGRVHYHEWLFVQGMGYCFVNDTMNPRLHESIDLFAWAPQDEHRVIPHHRKVYRLNKQPVRSRYGN